MQGRTAVLVMALTLSAPLAVASPEAVKLFQDGRELMKAGDFAAACDRFARSERLAPKVGTLLNLGACYDKLGQTASAWGAFQEARALATQMGDARRAAEAAQRIAAIEPQLAYVTLAVDATIEGLEIRRNGALVEPATWNTAVPLDPGDYELVATAPARLRWSSRHSVVDRGRSTVTVSLAIDPSVRADPAPFGGARDIPIRNVGIGLVAGANTFAHPILGARVVGNVRIPGAVIRGVGTATYSFYEDAGDMMAVPPEPPRNVNTVVIGVGVEYVRIPIAQLAFAIGAGFAMEIDSDRLGTDASGALYLRGSPVIVRLARGRIEAGLHVQFVVAADEERLEMLAGVDWFVR